MGTFSGSSRRGPAGEAAVRGAVGTEADGIIRALARRQRGVVTRRQLLERGISLHLIEHRVSTGLFDLAAAADARELENAVAEAGARRLATAGRLRTLLGCHPGAPGAARLRSLIDGRRTGLTRSEAEERFLQLVRSAGLEEPECNTGIEGVEVDFLWRRSRLIVEVDGFRYPYWPAAFEGDRRRDARLAAAGLVVMRVTPKQLSREPNAVLARLVQALIRRR